MTMATAGDVSDFGIKRFDNISAASLSAAIGWRAITAETLDYWCKLFDKGLSFVDKLLGARTIDEVVETQSHFAQATYTEFFDRLVKMNRLHFQLVNDALGQLTKEASVAAADATKATKGVCEAAKKAPATSETSKTI